MLTKQTYEKIRNIVILELFKTDEQVEDIVLFINDYLKFEERTEQKDKVLELRRKDKNGMARINTSDY